MRRVNNPIGRPRNAGEVLSVERAIKFAPSMMEALQARSRESGVTIAELVRRAVAAMFEKEKAPSKPPENSITFQIEPIQRAKLSELAVEFGYRDVGQLAEVLLSRAAKSSETEIHRFLFPRVITATASITTPSAEVMASQAGLSLEEWEKRGETAGAAAVARDAARQADKDAKAA